MGPRFLVRSAGLEMHPIDQADRLEHLKDERGIGYCNITKCCTEVCPEHIKITDNAIIPLKERVADEYYDPMRVLWRKLRGDAEGGTPAPAGRGATAVLQVDEPAPTDAEPRPEPSDGPPTLWADDPRRRAPVDDRAVRHPHRRRRARQPGAGLGGRGPHRRRARPDARDPLAPPDASISDFLGVQTNNVAEYTGSSWRSTWPGSSVRREVDLRLDSKLIVEQLHGRWRVKDAKLIPLWGEARRTLRGFSSAGRRTTCRGPRTPPPTRWRTRRSIASRRVARHRSCGGREPGGGAGVRCGMKRTTRRAPSSSCSRRSSPRADLELRESHARSPSDARGHVLAGRLGLRRGARRR